jgi:hypothetical protein
MATNAVDAKCFESDGDCGSEDRPPLDLPLFRPSWIDNGYTDEIVKPKVSLAS